ncbi:MAG: hypothetical protein K2N25_08450, partial [Muribaculaceae bacterium]|nr:hypothetical protein [Muribaculaceae bacterium]
SFMRNSTVVMLGISFMMALPVVAAPASPLKMMKDAKVKVFGKQSATVTNESGDEVRRTAGNSGKSAGLMKMSELARKMKPGTTKTFGWDDGKWMPEDVYTYVYDAEGNVTVENASEVGGGYTRTVSEYDSNNKVIFRESKISSDGVNFENNKKSEFEYDPILTNVITSRSEWLWDGEWLQISNNYKRIITRDEEGRITSVVIAVLFNGIYDPTQKLDITYGEDGKATTIDEQILGYNGKEYYWEQGTKISDIVWERTDGQIYDPEDLFIGNNRIGSARYEDSDGLDMNVTVEYANDSEAYTSTMAMTMEGLTITATLQYTPLENDGYISEGTTYFMGEVMYSSREEYRYDDWGLMTLSYESETEEGESYAESVVGEVEYDSEGMPLTYTISERYSDGYTDEEVIDYVIKAEYSDYLDVTAGVSPAIVDGVERCYDLNGLQVTKPGKGRIVVRDGRKVKY